MKITKIQDNDCHWYWIPNDKLEDFKTDLEEISGIDYMNNSEKFDEFINKYDDYRTGGSPDLMPDIFNL